MIEFEVQLEIIQLNTNFKSLNSTQQHQFLELVQDECAGIDDATAQVVDSIVECMYLQSPAEDLEETLQSALMYTSTDIYTFCTVLRNICELLDDFIEFKA